jgi:hypothetical protein
MNNRFPVLIAAFTVAVWAGYRCTQQTTVNCPPGVDCLDFGGGSRIDGGRDGGGDGGGYGGDGGCVNLQCQQVTCPNGGTTTVTGTVYDPSGQVPIYNALVYVPNGQVQPFTPGVTCDRCEAFTSGSPLVVALSGPDGTFRLQNVPVGNNIPLVIQVGRWRRQVMLPSIPACTSTPIIDVNLVRLPRNQSEGDIPQMAIATGKADPFECLLLKMGISPSEFTDPGGGGRIHYYVSDQAPGLDKSPPAPPEGELLSDAGTLMNYDVVLLPCEGGEYRRSTGPEPQNLVAYTAAGGRLFTTHYGYVWMAFPENNPFPSTGVWRPGRCDAYNTTLTTTVDQTFAKGSAFADWLMNVGSSTSHGFLDLHESRHDLLATDGGSQQWLYTNIPASVCSTQPQPAVLHMTFNTPLSPPSQPDGGAGVQCGRVVYSDFHVSASAIDLDGGSTFPGACRSGALSAQEKALLFMLLDVSSCIQSDNPTCPTLGQACSPATACCAGLQCITGAGWPCVGSATGCTCQPGILH